MVNGTCVCCCRGDGCQVACMQFINIVVHSVEDMNFRVHLQYDFTKLNLDEHLEVTRSHDLLRQSHDGCLLTTTYLSLRLSLYLSPCLSLRLSLYLSPCLCVNLSLYLLSTCLRACLCVNLSLYLSHLRG